MIDSTSTSTSNFTFAEFCTSTGSGLRLISSVQISSVRRCPSRRLGYISATMTPILPLDVHPYPHQLDTMKPLALSAPALLTPVLSQTIPQINGDHFLSSYNGESADVEGVITALSSNGVYLRSTTPDSDPRISNSIRVYNDSAVDASVGDLISVSGKVSEYRSSPDYIYLTELRASGSDFTVQSSDSDVTPIALGKDARKPPTEQFSSLDNGAVFGLPANTSQVSNENPELQPEAFGLDFWESLSAELVTVSRPRAVGKPNQYGDTWIVGDWGLNGSANARGGLTMREKGQCRPACFCLLANWCRCQSGSCPGRFPAGRE